MARQKMLILRGNSAPAGSYPDEQGNKIEWPIGALHVDDAREYARRKGYEGVVLDKPGQPQSKTSPQATAALTRFLGDDAVAAFYGFSGGGYNLKHILDSLAWNNPDTLHRIELVVVLGAPKQPKSAYDPSQYNAVAKKKSSAATWEPAAWGVVYRTNPDKSVLPKGVPKDTDPHMFGPAALLAETPAGRYRDTQFDDD